MLRVCLVLLVWLGFASFAMGQGSHIGGAQTSNSHVVTSPKPASPPTAPADSSGAAHVTVRTVPPVSHSPEKAEPAIQNAPTDPNTPVDLSDAAFAALVERRVPAQYPALARSTHAKGAVVLDVVLDQNGHLESADPIGSQDLAMACLEAIQSWTFKPYRYQGKPWKVHGSVRFNFLNPQKGTSD